MKRTLTTLAGIAFAAALPAQGLYDGSLGTLPTAQGWSFAAVPAGLARESHTGSAARLVTSASNLINAGYARTAPTPLDRATGFNLAVKFRLPGEAHARADRAGFSVIVLASDRRGIELGFWTNLVFAQSDNPLFVHAEEAAFDFTAAPTECVLSIRGDTYHLYTGGVPLLTGPVRDYTAFTGFPDVYETPNFIFLGDDTTSAGAEVEISSIALITPPTLRLATGGDGIEWSGVPGQAYRVEGSADLVTWSFLERVTSSSANFAFRPGGDASVPFLRVAHP